FCPDGEETARLLCGILRFDSARNTKEVKVKPCLTDPLASRTIGTRLTAPSSTTTSMLMVERSAHTYSPASFLLVLSSLAGPSWCSRRSPQRATTRGPLRCTFKAPGTLLLPSL